MSNCLFDHLAADMRETQSCRDEPGNALHITNSSFVTVWSLTWAPTCANLHHWTIVKTLESYFGVQRSFPVNPEPIVSLTIHYSTTYGQEPHNAILLILSRKVIYFLWHVKIIRQRGGRTGFWARSLVAASRLGVVPNTWVDVKMQLLTQ